MTGSNRRPSACKADALPAELILHIVIIGAYAWQRPTLTGGNPQLPSALRSLTSVFGMGTGVTFSPSLPDYFIEGFIPSKLDNISRQILFLKTR